MADCDFPIKYAFTGTILGHKKGKPYPLKTICNNIWLSKIKIEYEETEDDGEIEHYRYIGYPDERTVCTKRGIPFPTGSLTVGQKIHCKAESHLKSPGRGVLITIEVL